MPGAPDPLYVAARCALLDALDALGVQRNSVVLVGAQAIYVITGEGDLAVSPFTVDADLVLAASPFTTDADLALDPRRLRPEPLLDDAMGAGGFHLVEGRVGTWVAPNGVEVDLLVPDALGGPGRRAARIPPHGDRAARKVHGLEPVLIDQQMVRITSLEDGDVRSFDVICAGPAALLVAKLVKIHERATVPLRHDDKDALDVLRILRATSAQDLAVRLHALRNAEISGPVTEQGIELLQELFGAPNADGSQMAARATEGLEDPAVISASCAALATDILEALSSRG